MSTEVATAAPTPFHIWVDPYERGGQHIRGHWRPRSGQADQARAWLDDLETADRPRPLPQRGSQQPPDEMGAALTSDEPPIGEVLALLGVDRSEGRRWRRSGRHPALRWSRRDEKDFAGV